jgi:hypothetical protein
VRGPWPVVLAVAALLAACSSHIDSPPQPISLLDPSQIIVENPWVTITQSGVNPQTLHVDSPVTVKFTNNDTVAHKVEPAPELHFDNCPEFNLLGTIEPGQSASAVFPEKVVICAYHDAASPTNVAFQGLVVIH